MPTTLPFNLIEGTIIDAPSLMANFNTLLASINAINAITASPATFATTPIYSGDTSQAVLLATLGTSATPVNTDNAVAIFQKITTGVASGSVQNPTVYMSGTKTGSTSGYRVTPLLVEAYDNIGGNGSFIEGARFHATLGAASASGQATGIEALAESIGGAAWDFLAGVESSIENSTSDAPTTFNNSHFAACFLATNAQAGTSKIIDAYFLCNPFNAKAARLGFSVPAGAVVADAAFRSYGTSVYGLDLSKAVNSYACIAIPNNTAVMGRNAANSADMNWAYITTANILALGSGTVKVNIASGKLNITSIPTSSSGLTSGDVWSNAGVLTIV